MTQCVIPHLTYYSCYSYVWKNLKDLVTHLSRRSGEVAGITLSAASMFDSTSGITIFCKQEVEGDLVDRHGEVVTM